MIVGIVLVLVGTFFNAYGMELLKKGHITSKRLVCFLSSYPPENKTTDKQKYTAFGLLSVCMSVVCQFASTNFASMTILGPLGSVTIVWSALLSYFMDGVAPSPIAVVSIVAGMVVLVIFSPPDTIDRTPNDDSIWIGLMIGVVLTHALLHLSKWIESPILSALKPGFVGGFTQSAAKCFVLGLKHQYKYWWVHLTATATFAAVQLVMIDEAIKRHAEPLQVNALYMLTLSFSVVLISGTMFHELQNVSFKFVLGALPACFGVFWLAYSGTDGSTQQETEEVEVLVVHGADDKRPAEAGQGQEQGGV
jgi:drug/metabolite transporter (DMT)-like permease